MIVDDIFLFVVDDVKDDDDDDGDDDDGQRWNADKQGRGMTWSRDPEAAVSSLIDLVTSKSFLILNMDLAWKPEPVRA
jgi:hypothetical protein